MGVAVATVMIERELLEQVAERLELWFQGHGLAADKTLVGGPTRRAVRDGDVDFFR